MHGHVPLRSTVRFVPSLLVALCFLVAPTNSQEQFRFKNLLQKDLDAYAGNGLLLSVSEITLAPGATGTKHRHPGPTFVYVLEGAVEIELEGAPSKTYRAGESFYEEPHQLHIGTRNASQTEAARILAYHLSHKGEPLTQPENR